MQTSTVHALGALAPVLFGHDPLALADTELGAVLRRATAGGDEVVLSHWRVDGLGEARVAAARRLPAAAASLALDGVTLHLQDAPAPARLRAAGGWLTLTTAGPLTPRLAHALLDRLDEFTRALAPR